MINKEQQGLGDSPNGLAFTNSCRDALFQVLVHLKEIDAGVVLLLPAYIGLSLEEGSGIYDPVIQSGIFHEFYKLDENLLPNIESINSITSRGSKFAILLVNYFGLLESRYSLLRSHLSSRSILVIEDQAHSLMSLNSISKDNDFTVFSLHKFLGSNSGGILHSKDIRISFADTIEKKDLIHYSKTDLEVTNLTRLNNFKRVEVFFSSFLSPHFHPFFDGPYEMYAAPINFPIICKDNQTRHNLYLYLIENGIFPTALYHRLIPNLIDGNFPVTTRIADEILNLPTHQDMEDSDFELMLNLLERFSV